MKLFSAWPHGLRAWPHAPWLGLAFNHAYAKSLEIGTHSLRRHPSRASHAEDAHHLAEAAVLSLPRRNRRAETVAAAAT